MDHNGYKVYAVMARSVECSEIPEKSGIIRVDDYKQCCVLTTDGKVGSKGKDWICKQCCVLTVNGKVGSKAKDCVLTSDFKVETESNAVGWQVMAKWVLKEKTDCKQCCVLKLTFQWILKI
jgi:hypothetical protein